MAAPLGERWRTAESSFRATEGGHQRLIRDVRDPAGIGGRPESRRLSSVSVWHGPVVEGHSSQAVPGSWVWQNTLISELTDRQWAGAGSLLGVPSWIWAPAAAGGNASNEGAVRQWLDGVGLDRQLSRTNDDGAGRWLRLGRRRHATLFNCARSPRRVEPAVGRRCSPFGTDCPRWDAACPVHPTSRVRRRSSLDRMILIRKAWAKGANHACSGLAMNGRDWRLRRSRISRSPDSIRARARE